MSHKTTEHWEPRARAEDPGPPCTLAASRILLAFLLISYLAHAVAALPASGQCSPQESTEGRLVLSVVKDDSVSSAEEPGWPVHRLQEDAGGGQPWTQRLSATASELVRDAATIQGLSPSPTWISSRSRRTLQVLALPSAENPKRTALEWRSTDGEELARREDLFAPMPETDMAEDGWAVVGGSLHRESGDVVTLWDPKGSLVACRPLDADRTVVSVQLAVGDSHRASVLTAQAGDRLDRNRVEIFNLSGAGSPASVLEQPSSAEELANACAHETKPLPPEDLFDDDVIQRIRLLPGDRYLFVQLLHGIALVDTTDKSVLWRVRGRLRLVSPTSVSLDPCTGRIVAVFADWRARTCDEIDWIMEVFDRETGQRLGELVPPDMQFPKSGEVIIEKVSSESVTLRTDDGRMTVSWKAAGQPVPLLPFQQVTDRTGLGKKCRHPRWPLATGDRDVLHFLGTPYGYGLGWNGHQVHDGIDLLAPGASVLAACGGAVDKVITNQPIIGTTIQIRVCNSSDKSSDPSDCLDTYMHLKQCPGIKAGDVVAKGDLLGTVNGDLYSDSHGRSCGHLHWLPARSTWAHLKRFHFGDRYDWLPSVSPPRVRILPRDRKEGPERKNAWGSVDLLVRARDRMSAEPASYVNPAGIGYWIERIGSGPAVASSSNPYWLYEITRADLRFRRRDTHLVMSSWSDIAEPSRCGDLWKPQLEWVLTNAEDHSGSPPNSDNSEERSNFWQTDAKASRGTPAIVSHVSSSARSNEEARFPDGQYQLHVLLKDFAKGIRDQILPLLVDNFRPYIRKVEVWSGRSKVYDSAWIWGVPQGKMGGPHLETRQSAGQVARLGKRWKIKVEASEPMEGLSVRLRTDTWMSRAFGMDSSEAEGTRKKWQIKIGRNSQPQAQGDGKILLELSGRDLAGNELLRLPLDGCVGWPGPRTSDEAPEGEGGTDTSHRFPFSGR